MFYFLIGISIFCIIFAGTVVFLLVQNKKDMEKQLNDATISSNQDFMNKMEFFFNRFSQAKDETNKQTISVVEPISKTLDKLQRHLEDIQRYRIATDSNLHNSLNNVLKLQETLHKETAKLANVLKKPNTRGKWGEVQLKRIAEIVGMLPFCEFSQQCTDFEGIRPDMIVNLPNGGYLFIDAKTPLDAYLRALDTDEDIEAEIQKDNLKAVKNHIYSLSNKKYWTKAKSPDFVVMFIPVESVWLSAVELEPELMEYATEKNIIVATPMTLIGLLKTIFVGWTQVRFAEEADNLKKSLAAIETNLKTVSDHLNSINKYNGFVGNKAFQIKGLLEIITSEICNYKDISLVEGSFDDEEESKLNNIQNTDTTLDINNLVIFNNEEEKNLNIDHQEKIVFSLS